MSIFKHATLKIKYLFLHGMNISVLTYNDTKMYTNRYYLLVLIGDVNKTFSTKLLAFDEKLGHFIPSMR